jgi:hypothetical protein
MLRATSAAALLVLLVESSAAAGDLSGVRCEDQPMTDLIRTELPKMKFEDGRSIAQYLGNNSQLTAKTVSTAPDRVVCQITVNFTYNGSTDRIRGRFTYREFANGSASVTFSPFN